MTPNADYGRTPFERARLRGHELRYVARERWECSCGAWLRKNGEGHFEGNFLLGVRHERAQIDSSSA